MEIHQPTGTRHQQNIKGKKSVRLMKQTFLKRNVLFLKQIWYTVHTVDGRNLAPPGMYKTLWIIGIYRINWLFCWFFPSTVLCVYTWNPSNWPLRLGWLGPWSILWSWIWLNLPKYGAPFGLENGIDEWSFPRKKRTQLAWVKDRCMKSCTSEEVPGTLNNHF